MRMGVDLAAPRCRVIASSSIGSPSSSLSGDTVVVLNVISGFVS